MRQGKLLKTLLAVSCFAGTGLAQAEDSLEIGATIVGQHSSKNSAAITKNALGSLDVVADIDVGNFTLHSYIEASTTPDVSASSLVGGANADAGTALNTTGQARVQLSEIAIGYGTDLFNMNLGILDLTAFADATTTANDEGVQFLADALVNNASIPFPDYTAALVLGFGEEEDINATALIANGYGLGDNASANYADLLRMGNNSDGQEKGLFALTELRMPMNGLALTAGGWLSTSEFSRLDGNGTDKSTLGLYLNLDGEIAETSWSGRVGWNNARSEVTGGVVSFASVAVEHAVSESMVLGLGAAYSGISRAYKNSLLPDTGGHTTVVEAYYRWQITNWLSISPDIQYHKNPNNIATSSVADLDSSVWVYGLRLQISHEL